MDNVKPTVNQTPQVQVVSHSNRSFLKVFVTVVIIVAIVSGYSGYLLGKQGQNGNDHTTIPSSMPTQAIDSPLPSQILISPTTAPSSCTTDNECPAGYGCESLQGEGTACPSGGNITISCTPGYKITKGECRLKKDGICTSDTDCKSGLICHATQEGNSPIRKCEEPILGSCRGATDTSCQVGYQCTQGCGPPLIRNGENNTIPWNCTAQEIAGKPRACPICLASNTTITTPQGEVNVKDIKIGMQILSTNTKGDKIVSTVTKVGSAVTPTTHKVIHLVLSDGRALWVSPNHPTTTGAAVGSLKVGEEYDGAQIRQVQLVPYWDTKTYDLLPDSDTGFYFANGIRMGSTLK